MDGVAKAEELWAMKTYSADIPNLNKRIKPTMDTAVKEAGAPGLVDIGFCFIHKVHNAFKVGNDAFVVNALDFVISVFTWFHMYPVREEGFNCGSLYFAYHACCGCAVCIKHTKVP